ncbi:DUF5110 domain-containing protein [Proteiniclasticum sp. SCR006]|uniref:DUF5110 domain-containing protein n=1 Tax=Proteiniclasticum aestuarii TaxID=2817862 RepID=A0A939H7Y7_9CLOT|nr:TIM-barrel domain-containing protein [Proteiniclasticum aestuarii]MBO1264154.1 DUF5110 domain-containing protein [Proteiniclasticum aestuarii]
MSAFKLTKHVTGYTFGDPVETGIIQGEKTYGHQELPLEVHVEKGYGSISFSLTKHDRVYGLGPNLGGINKRGRQYESYCTDDPLHHEDKTTLYGAHNFFILEDDDVATGFFIDFPSRIRYDVGFTDMDLFTIDIHGEDFTLYIIEGDSLKDIVVNFHAVIGKPYMPPKWGLGFFQSRWGYETEEDIRKVYETFREKDIPLDGIYLDLDYMDDFKDFSLSGDRFPNFRTLVSDLKEDGVRLIPIIDAGVKMEEGYDVYDEGVAGNHFVKDESGKPYVAAVWPGKVHFPDFLQESTRAWFGDKYQFLTDLGIEGVWNDMNEPAIFYDETSLSEGIEAAIEAKGQNLGVMPFFALRDKFMNIGNRDEYYRRFYHEIDGKRYSNEEVHNLYGFQMTVSASEGLRKHLGKRHVLISRASSIGMHRYSGIWTGDNSSWWSHLDLNVKMLPALNMSGFYYVGADTGGFGGNASGELLTRWMQFSIFTPLLRNHSAIGCAFQEPYAFGEKVTAYNRHLIKARYSILPYLYSEMLKSYEDGSMMFTPLSFEYFGEEALQAEDQLLLGEELMIAPVVKSNARGRYVYLPEDMALVSFREDEVRLSAAKAGVTYLSYGMEDLKFFLRRNRMMPYIAPGRSVKDLSMKVIHLVGYLETEAFYTLYDDDGTSYGYEDGMVYKTEFSARRDEDGDIKVSVRNENPNIEKVIFTLMDGDENSITKEVQV